MRRMRSSLVGSIAVGALVVGAVLAMVAVRPSAAADTKKVKINARFVTAETGLFRSKADPGRCVSALFVIWPDVNGAISYAVEVAGFNGSTGATAGGPPFRHDRFPLTSSGKTHTFVVPSGSHWHNFGWYSTGTGCDDAKAAVLKKIPTNFKIVSATATIDPSKVKPKPRKSQVTCPKPKPESFFDGAPPGAIGRVTEVDGKQAWIQHKRGPIVPVKFKTWIFPGDIVVTDKKTVMSVEFITGGRAGVNKGVSARFSDETRLETIPDVFAKYPALAEDIHTRKKIVGTFSSIWKKISKKKEPLEVETAGGVMGCKG